MSLTAAAHELNLSVRCTAPHSSPSGLKFSEPRRGSGSPAKTGDLVLVDVVGRLGPEDNAKVRLIVALQTRLCLCLGLTFFYQTLTDHYSSPAHACATSTPAASCQAGQPGSGSGP